MQKESLPFGTGHFVAAINDPAFHELSTRDQARIAGWADGCPVVEKLTDPTNPDSGRGPEAMLPRYGEVNQWFRFIGQAVEDVNEELGLEFKGGVDRLSDEPVGQYEPESVPEEDYKKAMAPLGTLWGYAMPRLLTKQIGDTNVAENQERLIRGLEALDIAATTANTPAELLAIFSEELADKGDLKPETVLSGALSMGWYGEHNATTMLGEVKTAFRSEAPQLWRLYSSLTDAERTELKIA